MKFCDVLILYLINKVRKGGSMAWLLELEPPDRMVSGSSSVAVVLFPGKRVSVFLWTSSLILSTNT